MEDQPAVAAVIALELQRANIHVTTAPDGEQALALARAQKFDLILLDQWLPGMDGLEICRRLKGDPALRDTPVIFFTAYPSRYHEDEARRIHVVDYLEKGIEVSRLAARILSEMELARDRTSRRPLKPHPPQNGNAHPPHSEN